MSARVPGLVSTIIPAFNRPRQLREAVASVIEQDHRPVEVIVVDDGSTDATPDVARELAAAHPGIVHALVQPNAGPGMAREAGRRVARGEFIQYLDSDDVLLPGKFTRQVRALSQRPECGVAYGYTRYRHADGRVEPGPWKRSGERFEAMFPAFLRERWWDTPTPLYRASACDAAGPWTELRLEEDWEYDCRVAALGTRLVHCPEYVAEVRDHDAGRLCRGDARDPERLAQRARAHRLIYAHAASAGLGPALHEMQHCARELFLLARQCGAAGLAVDSKSLFELSRKASGGERGAGLDFRLYGLAAAVFGWHAMGALACATDRLRKSP
jgi:glycosyltransferase involved in cell wall biosynthesis